MMISEGPVKEHNYSESRDKKKMSTSKDSQPDYRNDSENAVISKNPQAEPSNQDSQSNEENTVVSDNPQSKPSNQDTNNYKPAIINLDNVKIIKLFDFNNIDNIVINKPVNIIDNNEENVVELDSCDEELIERLDEEILNEDTDDVSEQCRACLSKEKTKPMPDELASVFFNFTGLLDEANVPKVMCEDCETKLKDSNEFRNQCLQNNQWFIDKINSNSIQDETNDILNNISSGEYINQENILLENDIACNELIPIKTESTGLIPIAPRILNNDVVRKRKKVIMRVYNKDRDKLIPIPMHLVPSEIKDFISRMKNRPLQPIKPKPKEQVKEKIKELKKRKIYKPKPVVYFSDESDSNCDENAKEGKKRKIDGDETNENTENLDEQRENKESYNLHKDLVFDEKILENKLLIMPTFFLRRRLTIEEQKQNILDRKKSARYLRRRHKCDLCYLGFTSQAAFDLHMVSHTSKAGNLICEVCHVRKPTEKALKHHMMYHEFIFKCKYCPKLFSNRTKAVDHILMMHSTRFYSCNKCDYKSRSLTSLNGHKRTKHMCSCFCKYCGYSFTSNRGLNRHIYLRHKLADNQDTTDEVYCFRCDVHFFNREAYETHKKVSFQHGEFVALNQSTIVPSKTDVVVSKKMCEWCGFAFNNFSAFRCHIERAHPEKYEDLMESTDYILCELCGKNLKKENLVTHKKIVHKITTKRYECEVCNMKFRHNKNLKTHFRTNHYEEFLPKKNKYKDKMNMDPEGQESD